MPSARHSAVNSCALVSRDPLHISACFIRLFALRIRSPSTPYLSSSSSSLSSSSTARAFPLPFGSSRGGDFGLGRVRWTSAKVRERRWPEGTTSKDVAHQSARRMMADSKRRPRLAGSGTRDLWIIANAFWSASGVRDMRRA